MASRRAQGISVNVIIIAAIALVVMVILIALVLRAGGNTNRQVNTCEGLGDPGVHYQCVPEFVSDRCPDGWVPHPARACADSAPGAEIRCCIPLG